MSPLLLHHKRGFLSHACLIFPKPFRNCHGVTLLEVLVGLVLLSLALLALSGLSTTAIKGTVSGKKLTIGTLLAQEKIEERKGMGFVSSLVGRMTTVEPYDSFPGFPEYQRITVSEAQTPGSDMQTVMVTVKWDKGAHAVVLSMVLGR